jgi:ABC-type branched-subunit amino acid transport system ATPase component/branched-subunit amino acid ABC-type transport system permease component
LDQHITFLLLGLANGAVFALLALALVVTFRSSGVINFATGAIALYTAYVYAFLRQGQLLLLIPGVSTNVDLGRTLGFWPAALISIVITCALVFLLYLVVFRPLRSAPPVAKAVASIGVMIAMTGTIQQRVGTSPVIVDRLFPATILKMGSVQVSADRLGLALTVIGLTLVLGALYRFTRFGLRTRAAAETEKGAYTSGISPDRIAAYNWIISGAVAAIAGILIAPISPLVPYSYTLFIVPALAAAIVGNFRKLGPAVAAGLAIGMLQSEMTFLKVQHSWLPSSGLAELVPLVVILVVLVVRAKPLPSRGVVLKPDLGRAPRPVRILMPTVVGVAIGVVALAALHGSARAALVTGLIFGVISLSLVVVTGYAGQVSLAQLTLAGVGGFLVATIGTSWGVPFPIAPLLAACGATVIGVVVGLPALRVRGLPVAVVTLSLAVALQALWFRNSDIVPSAGKNVTPPSLFGIDLGPGTGAAFPRLPFCLMVLAVLALVGIGVAKLRVSRLGSSMLAVRANERSASASGINVVTTKIAAFAIGAFIAGLGGSLLGYRLGNVTWDSFDVLLGLGMFATVYLVGVTSVSGGIVAGLVGYGGILYYAADKWLSVDQYWFQIVSGALLVLTVILHPEGLMGPIHRRLAERGRARDRADELSVDRSPAARVAVPSIGHAVAEPAVTGRTVLSIEGVAVRYGGVVALTDVSFDVAAGSIVGLIGPNGAGKTTLVDAITGFTPCEGRVAVDGVDLGARPPYLRNRAGLARTFQGLELWSDLTVEENVQVGHRASRRSHDDVAELLALLGLEGHGERLAGELSQGQRQMVSIARALVSDPTVLLLDEPAAGLDTNESEALGVRLRSIRDAGVTIVLIDHDMELVLNLCDEIQVLDFGKLIASGPPDMVRADRRVTEAYLGGTHAPDSAGVG